MSAGPTISLCMMVKDESRFLSQCLKGARAVVDEMIVIDTGSRDGTQGIARRCGAKVIEIPWADDFSGMRNATLERAKRTGQDSRISYLQLIDATG